MSSSGGRTVVGVMEQVLHYHLVQAQQGLLPSTIHASAYKRILHLNCRTGAWAIDFSLSYPDVDITGLDSMPHFIEVAQQHTSVGDIRHAHFATHQIDQPLPFADNTFDLLHFFLFLPVLRPSEWPVVLRDYWRVLRPGGTISLACLALGANSSNAYYRLLQMLEQFFRAQGYAFSEQAGSLFHGAYLPPLLRRAGFERIVYTLSPVNFGGWKNGAGRACCQLFLSEIQQNKQAFVGSNLISDEEFDAVTVQKLRDTQGATYYAAGTLLSIAAVKAQG
ncbi:MAG: methyltransferase domain-containing protein [Ktedonobacteraceae bacterium]|nr:methyltransferase domain-containing protein [Ktedonobacteraceae bacterium]